MKITILLRYPKAEKNRWKKELIQQLIASGHEVSLLFGETSYWRHAKAALKEYGTGIRSRKKSLDTTPSVKLYPYFKSKIAVCKVNDLNGQSAENLLRKIQPDYLLLLGTGMIRENILSIPNKGTIHCHHGDLPDVRGMSTAEWSILLHNEVWITTHIVDPGVDTGDILLKKQIPLTNEDTIESVRLNCREHSIQLIVDTFAQLVDLK